MSDEALRTEFETARLAGDYATLERIGPLFYPEDGAAPPAPAPAADSPHAPHLPASEYARRTRELREEMQKTNMGSPQMAELQEELNGLYQQRYPEGTPTQAAMTRDAWRPDLPPGYTWDETVVADFEETAPGGPTLMHVVADAVRSSRRYDDADATIATLEARYGEAAAVGLAEDATAYLRQYGNRRIEAELRGRGLLYHPELIYRAAMFWRQRDGRG